MHEKLVHSQSINKKLCYELLYKAQNKHIEAARLVQVEYSTSNDHLTDLLKAYYHILVETCPDLATICEATINIHCGRQLVIDGINKLFLVKEKFIYPNHIWQKREEEISFSFFTKTASRYQCTIAKNDLKNCVDTSRMLKELNRAISIKQQALACLQFRQTTLNNQYHNL